MASSPTLLIVDDKLEEAATYIDLFTEIGGFRVVTARSSEEAFRRVNTEPAIEAVSTDISLTSEGIDIDGAALAQHLFEYLPGIPIAGYSGFRSLDALPDEYQRPFKHWIERGESADRLTAFVEQLRTDALEYRDERAARTEQEGFATPSSLEDEVFERVTQAFAEQDAAPSLGEILSSSGFVLRAVMPVFRLGSVLRAKSPVVCWLRGSEGRWEGEVVAQPRLYAEGASADDVLRRLVELVEVFADRFGIALSFPERPPCIGPAKDLVAYLDSIIERRQ